MLFFSQKQAIYNIIFFVGLLMSSISAFTILTNNGAHISVSGTPLTGKVVVIDAGHGSPDGGATGYKGSNEKDLNLAIAKKTGDFLIKCGAYVVYTRGSDESIADDLNDSIAKIKKSDMAKRIDIRDNSDADIFISIHMNVFSDNRYSGAQVFYSKSAEGKKLAQNIQLSLKNNIDKSNNREVVDAGKSIYVLNNSPIPSVLVECGFISNPDEEKKLMSTEYQDKIAASIGEGIIKFLTIT